MPLYSPALCPSSNTHSILVCVRSLRIRKWFLITFTPTSYLPWFLALRFPELVFSLIPLLVHAWITIHSFTYSNLILSSSSQILTDNLKRAIVQLNIRWTHSYNSPVKSTLGTFLPTNFCQSYKPLVLFFSYLHSSSLPILHKLTNLLTFFSIFLTSGFCWPFSLELSLCLSLTHMQIHASYIFSLSPSPSHDLCYQHDPRPFPLTLRWSVIQVFIFSK